MKLPKETDRATQRHGRWYDDACGTAFALELVGERWSLLIVRELMFGGRRFSDLRAGLPGISAKVLTERLEGLEQAGVAQRRALAEAPGVRVYELTEWGKRADVAIMELGRWAAMSPRHDPTLPLSPASLMLSFRTMFDPARAKTMRMDLAMVVAAQPFALSIANQALRIRRGHPDTPDVSLTAPDAMTVAAAVYGKVPLANLPALVVSDPAAMRRFVDLFHLPAKLT